ncbi:MAG TPA: PH domain-containing protein [Gemmatimonadaceae bacterium]|nr:PH domain-containing protein [Gemmatimonadaceae bacterium]
MTSPTPEVPDESPVWSGTPSQWLNFESYLYASLLAVGLIAGTIIWSKPVILGFVLIPAAGAFWKWLSLRCTRIDVTTQRISTRTGVFSRERSDMELYRVKDTTLREPFFLRIVGLANIALVSSDKSTPDMMLAGIRNAEELRQKIRTHVERMRATRRVRELDFE